MRRVYQQIVRVAATAVSVFITGESGTGKEVVARTVHDLSRRRSNPFLAVNCGAISPHLMESEIFGHEKGSFTGAERQHLGFFERTNGGTLFLDEITEMPLDLQVKLLRVLESGTFMRVGSTQVQETDVRIIAATNRNPNEAVTRGKLREDLLYRLNVFPIHLPPLRERIEDIPLIARHFLAQIGEREGAAEALRRRRARAPRGYRWPGNVRELRNVVYRAYVMTPGATIQDDCLPHDRRRRGAAGGRADAHGARRRDARRGRAAADAGHARAPRPPQGKDRGDARHQPEDALQPAQGIRRRRRRSAERAGRARRGALSGASARRLRPARLGVGAEQVGEAAGIERLDEERIEAGGERALLVFGARIAGDRGEHHRRALQLLAQRLDEAKAVHAGQADVAQDDLRPNALGDARALRRRSARC